MDDLFANPPAKATRGKKKKEEDEGEEEAPKARGAALLTH